MKFIRLDDRIFNIDRIVRVTGLQNANPSVEFADGATLLVDAAAAAKLAEAMVGPPAPAKSAVVVADAANHGLGDPSHRGRVLDARAVACRTCDARIFVVVDYVVGMVAKQLYRAGWDRRRLADGPSRRRLAWVCPACAANPAEPARCST